MNAPDEKESDASTSQAEDEITNSASSPSQDYEPICVINPSGKKPGTVSKIFNWLLTR